MIKSLLNPKKYPDNPEKVKLVQTHISYVFISKKFVYKIKKPVNFGFLDFTTLEKRKLYCEKEIILNSRLSPDIYKEVIPIKIYNNEYYFNGNEGEIVDYAVVMKRINEDNLLKNMLKTGNVDKEIFKKIAERLVEFHNRYPASVNDAEHYGSIKMLKVTTDENFTQTEKYINITIDKDKFYKLKEYTENFYKKDKDLFKERIKNRKIVEAHGDLHLEHVGIENGLPFFLDCIEFNERFRIIDIANEIAFLSMDLDFNGYEGFSKDFIKFYKEISNDTELITLLRFYKIYRAYVRGKVTSFLLDDENISQQEKEAIAIKAKKYFELAFIYLEKELP